jgi:ketosteroid isomerase-like protein
VSENKRTIEKYIEGFTKSDHEQVLSCLTDDVEWEIPGAFQIAGKAAFDKEIENPAFTGRPSITTSRMTEENDVVVAEGSVRTQRVDGSFLNLRFCDVFVMHEGKIRRLISHLVEIK